MVYDDIPIIAICCKWRKFGLNRFSKTFKYAINGIPQKKIAYAIIVLKYLLARKAFYSSFTLTLGDRAFDDWFSDSFQYVIAVRNMQFYFFWYLINIVKIFFNISFII